MVIMTAIFVHNKEVVCVTKFVADDGDDIEMIKTLLLIMMVIISFTSG